MKVKLNLFESAYNVILSNIRECLGKTLAWIIDSAVSYSINISQHNPISDSNYIKLPKELDHPKKGLINILNINDNKCFKWCLDINVIL